MRALLIRFTVTLTPGCLDRMVATNCSLTGRTKQQRYKGTCGAAEFAKSSRENWSHGEQTVIVNARLSPGHPRLLMSSPGLPAPLKLRRASAGHTSALSRPNSPELCKDNVPRKTEGAGKAGCPMHPQPRTQQKSARVSSPQVHRNSPGLPCAMVLTAYTALSPATNSSCHRRPRIKADQPGRADFASVDLAPATGVRTTRFCRPRPPFEKAARRIWYQSAEALAKADQRRSSCAL